MALIDVVKYDGDDREFAWKFPSENLRLGTQLVVKPGQTAFFVKNGQILDQFEPGTVTLTSGNIPLLTKLISLPFGGNTPFQAEVWFINRISKLDNKWGTVKPIQLEDPKYGVVVPVRSFGQYGFSVSDPRKFFELLVGTVKSYSAQKINEYFNGLVLSTVTSELARRVALENISLLQIPALLDHMSKTIGSAITEEFAKFGIGVLNFYIISINFPEEDPSVVRLKEAKEKAMYLNTVGRDVYQFEQTTEVLKAAASNEGTAGGVMGAGMGLGMGLGVGNVLGGQFSQMTPQSLGTTPPPIPNLSVHFFVALNGQQAGPFDINQLSIMSSSGQIDRKTLVWKQGMAEWAPASTLSELGALFQGAPPPIPQ